MPGRISANALGRETLMNNTSFPMRPKIAASSMPSESSASQHPLSFPLRPDVVAQVPALAKSDDQHTEYLDESFDDFFAEYSAETFNNDMAEWPAEERLHEQLDPVVIIASARRHEAEQALMAGFIRPSSSISQDEDHAPSSHPKTSKIRRSEAKLDVYEESFPTKKRGSKKRNVDLDGFSAPEQLGAIKGLFGHFMGLEW